MDARRLLPAAAVVLVASGCGSEQVRDAASVREAAEDSARVEIVSRLQGQAYDYRTTGVVDYARDQSEYVTEGSLESHSITIGDATYTRLEPPLAGGRTWLRRDGVDTEADFEAREEERKEEQGENGSRVSIVSLYRYDTSPEPTPTGYVAYLRAVGAELEAVGSGEVRGVPTTRLRGALSSHRAARHDLAAAGWKESNIERYLETLVDTTTEVEVWVDAERVVHRIVETSRAPADFAPPGQEPPTNVTTTEFYDFGVDASIEPPPSAEVLEWKDWARLAEERFRADLEGAEAEEKEEGIVPIEPFGETGGEGEG